jgi:hypothetical protein
MTYIHLHRPGRFSVENQLSETQDKKILSRKPTFGNTRQKDSDGWQKDAHGQR